ncbi:MAG: hypothetical protein WCH39_21015 [Schlesneria sp.]
MAIQGPRILQNTVSSGTGPFALLTPTPPTFQAFRDVFPDGTVTTVLVLDQTNAVWSELLVKLTYGTPDTLTVLAVISSSNGGSAVSFTTANKMVIQCMPSYGSQAVDRMKQAVRAVSLTNLALSSVVAGLVVDGVTLSAGHRLGLFGQTTATERGIWVVPASGSAARSLDFNAGDVVSAAVIPCLGGTVHAAQVFMCTSAAGSDIVGTSSLTFAIGVGQAGATGATGPANSLAIGTVTTLSAGASATATITGTAPTQTLNLGLPAGPTGATGAGTGSVNGIVKGDGAGAINLAVAGTDYVAAGTATVFTKQQNFGTQTLTDGSAIAWNLATQQVARVTLGGNRQLSNPSNLVDGGTYILIVKQDGAGSRTLTYGTQYKWAGASPPTLSTGANAVDILTFVSDGTYLYGVAQKAFG